MAFRQYESWFIAYRYVEVREWLDIQCKRRLRTARISLEGKWVASSAGDAKKWGGLLDDSFDGRVVTLAIPALVFDTTHQDTRLDGIGPAAFLEKTELTDVLIVAMEPA